MCLGSGDWMERNFDRRVDILLPIDDPAIKNRLIDHILLFNLTDNVQARELTPEGTVRRRRLNGSAAISVQEILLSGVTPPLETATVHVRPPSLRPAAGPGHARDCPRSAPGATARAGTEARHPAHLPPAIRRCRSPYRVLIGCRTSDAWSATRRAGSG
ncbi:MAG: hypothetical protein HY815_13025 [Candidatus Riflebacteria bacterium]|nr:hypothetical protein [Candidatus Riflebacteria bacterium]